jgi:signal transduction histidine kinase
VALCVSVLVSIWSRWLATAPAGRRALTPGLVGGTVVVATLLVERTAILLLLPPSAGVVLAWSAQVVLVVWPVALLLGLLRSRLDRSGVGRLVVELGDGPAVPARLRSVVARTLHDPSADVAYRVSGTDTYVDAVGRPVDVTPGDGRAVTHLERDGEPVAVLLHDPALAGEPALVEAVAAGAGLAVENERLQAEVRQQLAEVRASRTRLVEAADAARRRVERDLHDGAQQRLVAVGLALRLARARLADAPADELEALLVEAGDELTAALAELRELARGIYPALLTEAGLGPALTSLAERAPVPVVLGAVPPQRPPEPVEQTCYFVVSEAVTNAAKHASASRVEVSVVPDGGDLRVEVADDGVGGADAEGSGLRGLADRVAALGGHLRVTSPAAGGTRVTATVPCG